LTAIFELRQDARLTALWEQYGGRPGHVDRIASALDAGVAKSAVAARLKALGLKRGVLTEGQVRGGRAGAFAVIHLGTIGLVGQWLPVQWSEPANRCSSIHDPCTVCIFAE
jgi:hypothetical protein